MSMICGWLPNDDTPDEQASHIVEKMCRALRVSPVQAAAYYSARGIALGVLELAALRTSIELTCAPAIAADNRYFLWIFGEIYSSEAIPEISDIDHSRIFDFKQALLEHILQQGIRIIGELDGAYNIVLWDAKKKN